MFVAGRPAASPELVEGARVGKDEQAHRVHDRRRERVRPIRLGGEVEDVEQPGDPAA